MKSIAVATYDEHGQVSVFVPPEAVGAMAVTANSGAVLIAQADNAAIALSVNDALHGWSFENELRSTLVATLQQECVQFIVLPDSVLALTTAEKRTMLGDSSSLGPNTEVGRKLMANSIDGLLLVTLRYYGPYTPNQFASCRLKCDVDVRLIPSSGMSPVAKSHLDLNRRYPNEILFGLTMDEYLAKDCRALRASLERASALMAQTIASGLCGDGR
ncbi:MAG: hypothetical protein WDA75_19105 [Candidatus Latescibacterota bacterium]|jgi:plasmid stability protein